MASKRFAQLTHRLLDFNKLRFKLQDKMRYDDVGDYYENTIIAFDMKDMVINNAILIHEFIEYTLIRSAGLTPEMIDKLDTDPDANKKYPEAWKLYNKFHRLANRIERQFIENLGFNWDHHEEKIYTTRVKVAVQKVTDELHKPHPSPKKLRKQKKIVKEAIE